MLRCKGRDCVVEERLSFDEVWLLDPMYDSMFAVSEEANRLALDAKATFASAFASHTASELAMHHVGGQHVPKSIGAEEVATTKAGWFGQQGADVRAFSQAKELVRYVLATQQLELSLAIFCRLLVGATTKYDFGDAYLDS
eukprot:2142530-Amphidinium_carterae.2